MKTDFPDYIFDTNATKLPIFNYQSGIGKNICSTKKIVFCGICRDVEQALELNIDRIIRTSNVFQESSIFLYENDSKDNTRSILTRYKNENKIDFISEKRNDKDYRENIDNGLDPWHFNRCKILSDCRNKYLNIVKTNFSHYDYMCVLDLDIKGGWSYDGFYHSIFILESDPKYACVSAYGVLSDPKNETLLEDTALEEYIMYDSLAFRPKHISNGIHMLDMPMFNAIVLSKGQDPIEVNSNFGGMCVYKINPIIETDASYGAKQWGFGEVDPDHVVFNRHLTVAGYKIILDPGMIVSYSDHLFSRTCYDKLVDAN